MSALPEPENVIIIRVKNMKMQTNAYLGCNICLAYSRNATNKMLLTMNVNEKHHHFICQTNIQETSALKTTLRT